MERLTLRTLSCARSIGKLLEASGSSLGTFVEFCSIRVVNTEKAAFVGRIAKAEHFDPRFDVARLFCIINPENMFELGAR